MNELFRMLVRFLREFHFWFVVSPGEKAVRVRFGKHVKTMPAGFHLKLPIADRIFLQSDRMRITSAGKQTLTTKDGKVITISCSVGYYIEDIELLYRTLHHPEDTIIQLVKAAVTETITASNAKDLSFDELRDTMDHLVHRAGLHNFGLGGGRVYITDVAMAKPFRLIGDYSDYTWGQKLNTEQSTSEKSS